MLAPRIALLLGCLVSQACLKRLLLDYALAAFRIIECAKIASVVRDSRLTKNDSDERNGDEQNDDAKHDEEESGDARTEG